MHNNQTAASPPDSTLCTVGQPSLLDTQETTCKIVQDYRQRLFDRVRPEFDATIDLYSRVDSIQGTDYLNRLMSCRSQAWFLVHRETGHVKIASNACRLRWCPVCARGKVFRISENVTRWLNSVRGPKFLTLTLKHSYDPLSVQVNRLYSSFLRLRRNTTVRKSIRGGVWFFQITYNADRNQWHPHLHVAIDSGYIAQSFLSSLWNRITGDSIIVDIRTIKDKSDAAKYIGRYVARPMNIQSLNSDSRLELFLSLEGRRFYGAFGNARGYRFSGVFNVKPREWLAAGAVNWHFENVGYNNVSRALLHAYWSQQPLPEPILAEILRPPPDFGSDSRLAEFLIEHLSTILEF